MAAGPDGCLLELDYFPCCKSCAYGLCAFCCWGVFPVLTLYSPRSIVWVLFFFSSLSSCIAVIFFNSLSSCPVYPLVIYVCCMYGQVDGLFHWYLWLSDNKGLLLLNYKQNSISLGECYKNIVIAIFKEHYCIFSQYRAALLSTTKNTLGTGQ